MRIKNRNNSLIASTFLKLNNRCFPTAIWGWRRIFPTKRWSATNAIRTLVRAAT